MHPARKEIFIAFAAMILLLLVGCSPRVRSIFFDGVPVPDETAARTKNDTLSHIDSARVNEVAAKMQAVQYDFHPPYQGKKCNLCHDPGGAGKLIKPQPGLCYECHDDFTTTFKFIHGPVGGGFCTTCHNPHMTELKKLVTRKGQELCLNCHDQGSVLKQEAHRNIGKDDCTGCHNPHGGNKKYFLN
jgi:predicted CXXCH cytochrome family protein